LAAREQVAPPTMTKVVEKLEAQGFVTRQADVNDRRVSRVSITPAGRRFLDVTRLRRTAWLAERLDQMPAEELAKVADALGGLELLISVESSTGPSGR
jgi:DNA-binding MarR family transcriptional regulator